MRAVRVVRRVCCAVAVAVVAVALVAPVAVAAPPKDPTQNLNSVITNLVKVIVGLLAGLATLFLTIGGVLYLTAAGDPEQVSRAKNALKSAAIGYGIAVLAPMLVLILKSVVGQK